MEKNVAVLFFLTSHVLAAFYLMFEPGEVRMLIKRFVLHYTPKHGNWLNKAKIDLSTLVYQCLYRRISDTDSLIREVKAWAAQRNIEVIVDSSSKATF